MKAKPPQILTDIYRDLRDRHLLLPALALIVALIAVPVLLREPAAEAPLPTAAQPPSSDATAVTSAVLVDDSVNVRNYRKRLAALKQKNPFESNFSLPGGGSGSTGGGGSSGDGATTTDGATSTDTATSTDVSGASDITPTDTGSTTDTGGTATDTGSTTEPVQPEIRFYAGRVDVTIGPLGKAKDYDNVKYLNFLPDDKAPLVAFIGLTGDAGESAVFAVSSDVEMGEGDGSCAPKKPDPCQFLTLKPGEQRYMKYGGKSYRLKLRDTHVVQIPDPRDAAADSQGDAAGSGYSPSGDGSGG